VQRLRRFADPRYHPGPWHGFFGDWLDGGHSCYDGLSQIQRIPAHGRRLWHPTNGSCDLRQIASARNYDGRLASSPQRMLIAQSGHAHRSADRANAARKPICEYLNEKWNGPLEIEHPPYPLRRLPSFQDLPIPIVEMRAPAEFWPTVLDGEPTDYASLPASREAGNAGR
jgi:hypothetical protein